MYRDYRPNQDGGIKRVVTLLGGVFLVSLAVVIGTRMSSDAIAVVVGVIAGVAASIPTALLLLAVTRRREDDDRENHEERRQMAPPVIVVAPGAAPQVVPQYGGAYPQQIPAVSGPRRFRVMGYDEEDMEPLEGQAQEDGWYG